MTAALAAAATVAGCGGDSAESVTPGSQPTPSGTLRIALPDRPESLDPLLATSAADRLVVGQVYEPLTRTVSGPYGQGVSQPGLALWSRPSAGGTIWQVRLRSGVRFGDGARFNAAAILQNAMRWRSTPEGQALLPGLVAADAPAPDLVRFIFDRPVDHLERRLASVRLGIVSPRDLRLPDAGRRLANGLAAGTGPFEIHRPDPREILLARNSQWWGTREQLGPGVDLIALRFPQSAASRLSLLVRGSIQIAEGLGREQLPEIRRDPLLTSQPGPGGSEVGVSREVRGFEDSQGTPLLSRTWLTTVGTGEG